MLSVKVYHKDHGDALFELHEQTERMATIAVPAALSPSLMVFDAFDVLLELFITDLFWLTSRFPV